VGKINHAYSPLKISCCDVILPFILNFINSKFTNVHPPNRFAHKEGIWYDYLCPHKKEEMTRMTSQQEIFKGE
jgi:hypothetical protein